MQIVKPISSTPPAQTRVAIKKKTFLIVVRLKKALYSTTKNNQSTLISEIDSGITWL